jgi:hypothetical protein
VQDEVSNWSRHSCNPSSDSDLAVASFLCFYILHKGEKDKSSGFYAKRGSEYKDALVYRHASTTSAPCVAHEDEDKGRARELENDGG